MIAVDDVFRKLKKACSVRERLEELEYEICNNLEELILTEGRPESIFGLDEIEYGQNGLLRSVYGFINGEDVTEGGVFNDFLDEISRQIKLSERYEQVGRLIKEKYNLKNDEKLFSAVDEDLYDEFIKNCYFTDKERSIRI